MIKESYRSVFHMNKMQKFLKIYYKNEFSNEKHELYTTPIGVYPCMQDWLTLENKLM